MRPKQKLLVYIKFINKSDQIVYTLTPAMQHVDTIDGEYVYEHEFDSGSFDFKVKVENITSDQVLIITKIKINNVDLTTGMDKFGRYITHKNKRKATYGYMDEPGVYKFRIKYNAMFMQYMSYLLGQAA